MTLFFSLSKRTLTRLLASSFSAATSDGRVTMKLPAFLGWTLTKATSFPFRGDSKSAGGGIRTHEGLRHGMTHPRCGLGLEFGARGQDATRPSSQTFLDLALGPPRSLGTCDLSSSVKALRYCANPGLGFVIPSSTVRQRRAGLQKFDFDKNILGRPYAHQALQKSLIRVHIDEAFVDPHLPLVPCVGALSTGALARGDIQFLRWKRYRAPEFHAGLVSNLCDFTADGV